MRFLREHNGKVEDAWMPDEVTSKEKSHALFVLGDAVIVARHPYDRSFQSSSGNCWCGRATSDRIHIIVKEE